MKSFAELSKLVDTEEIRLFHVVGVPRSMSTALGRALNETEMESVYVNEPFNRANSNTDQAAHFILDAIKQSNSPAELVIVKNMASYLSDESFSSFDSISARNIWTIRHPLRQLESLVTRLVNDLVISPGADALSQSQVYDHIDEACNYLIDSPKSKNFSKTGWKSISRLFDLSIEPYSIVDGELFSAEPSAVLGRLCAELTVPFSGGMVDGWSEDFVNVVNIDSKSETWRSAWTNEVSASTGVKDVRRSGLDLAKAPESLRDHVARVALPAYVRLSGLGDLGGRV